MKRFRFPLRPVAVLRAHQEICAREAFAAAVHVYVMAEEELGATRTRIAELEAALFHGRQERFSAAGAADSLASYRRERAAEIETERAMITARATMQERRLQYLESHRRLEVVKRLEDKAKLAHRQQASRDEQAEFDDFSGRRFAGRGRSFLS